MENPFVLPSTSYKRNLNFYPTYVKDAALLIHKTTGKDLAYCEEWVRKTLSKDGAHPLVDPVIDYLERGENGDRELKQTTLSQYFKRVDKEKLIISPNLTGYIPPTVKVSFSAEYVKTQLAARSANKKLALKYKQQDEKQLASIYNNRQQRNKIKCNSLSGAQGTPSSFLFNKSAHSTLTSICRSASSNTNASTERFLSGNRHYWSVDQAINNIVNIVRRSDYNAIQFAVDTYDLVYPSVEDVLWAVKRCTDLYWRDASVFARIERIVNALTPIERAAYLYTGDLFNLTRLNDSVIRRFFTLLSFPSPDSLPHDEAVKWMKQLEGDEIAMLRITCTKLLFGKNDKGEDAYLEPWNSKIVNGDTYGQLGATAKQILEARAEYAGLIRAFWVTPNMPSCMAAFPSSIRRCVVASDTDSSIFTTQDWATWYVGEFEFSDTAFAVTTVATYFCSQITAHVLATMSANMGVVESDLRTLEMKNEYAFNMFSLTSMGKHYFAAMAAQEGGVYMHPHWEIKGATLKNSKAPPALIERAANLIEEIGTTVMAGEKIAILPVLREVAEKELEIRKSIEMGDPFYYSSAQIKQAESYKNGANTPAYLSYSLWNDVFGPKYGIQTPPPYGSIKVSIDTDTPTKFCEWLQSLEDQDLAARFRFWMEANGKNQITTLYLPLGLVQKSGVPKELLPRMNIRSLIFNLMRTYYLILESLGIYMSNENITRLVSDDYIDTAAPY